MSDVGRFYVKRYSPYTGSTFWVHYAFGDIANLDNDYLIFASNDYLKLQWPLSDRAIDRARAQLLEDGFMTEVVKPARGRRARYRFEFPVVPETGRCLELTVALREFPTPANLATDSNACQKGGQRLPKARTTPLIGTKENSPASTDVDAVEKSLTEALRRACGWAPDRNTPSSAKSLREAVAELLCEGVTVDQVALAASVYRQRWPNAGAPTLGALMRHWPTLVPDSAGIKAPASTSDAERAGLALANRGVHRAEAIDELTDLFEGAPDAVAEGLCAFERRVEVGAVEVSS